jgi:Zn-dependent peptidase ImmA (M78 family)
VTAAEVADRIRAIDTNIVRAALTLLGERGIVLVPGLRELGRLETTHGTRVVVVRAELPREAQKWVVGHELGHFFGLTDEDACDEVADLLVGVGARPEDA